MAFLWPSTGNKTKVIRKTTTGGNFTKHIWETSDNNDPLKIRKNSPVVSKLPYVDKFSRGLIFAISRIFKNFAKINPR